MMNIEEMIATLLTGKPEIDELLKQAAQLGFQAGREDGRQIEQRNQTLDHLRCLVRSGMDLERAMVLFQLPKKERNTYRKIFQNYAKQKERG